MKRITVLSGKGGTGKTSITSSLAVLLARKHKVITVDCDVDTPNLGLTLGLRIKDFSWQRIQTNEKASLIKNKCMSCKDCLSVCAFNAISWNIENQLPVFNKFLCEGCGACGLVCPTGAVKLRKVSNGRIGFAESSYGFKVITGQLKMGESGSGKIVTLIKNKAERIADKEKCELMLVDSAAGIGCPVIASVQGSDYVIAVTEPTPSALSDLKRALKVVKHFRIPHGLIINKYDLNKEFSRKIEGFASKNGISLIERIPYDKKFVEALINLKPVIVYDKSKEKLFSEIISKILL